MDEPAHSLFESLDGYGSLEELIDNGESEGQHLECKSPKAPRLDPGLKKQLAEAVSGFSNSGGGVILWGISTTKKAHTGEDVLTQIEPIGNCAKLARQIDRAIPAVAVPTVQAPLSRVITASVGATRGVVVTHVPPTPGDPVQSLLHSYFYLRTGDEFVKMPYDVLKRMFAGTSGPVLEPVLDGRIVALEPDGSWKIPISLMNTSSAAAEETQFSLEVLNPSACKVRTSGELVDVSYLNPGHCLYMAHVRVPIYRGINLVYGTLRVSMKKGKRRKRALYLAIVVYSSRMRARKWRMTVHLTSGGFSVKQDSCEYLY